MDNQPSPNAHDYPFFIIALYVITLQKSTNRNVKDRFS